MRYDKLDNEELLRIAVDAVNHGRHADAMALLKTLLERDPDSVFGNYLLAAEHMQLGMVERAEEGFRKAVALAPDFPMARFQLGQLYMVKGDAAAAKTALSPLSSLPTGTALSGYAKGMLAAANEDIDAAIGELQMGLACEQDNPDLAGDMQRVLDNLLAMRSGEAPAAPGAIPSSTASLYLSGYGKADH